MNKSIKMAIFGITAFVIMIIGFTTPVFAAPMGDGDMPERIPFTNKPVIPGNPESYIGTYGQCPFYENAMEKGCFPPSDIECNSDWSFCQPRTASVTPAPVESAPIATSAPNTPQTTPKSTNSGYSGAGTQSSYAPLAANDTTNVNETPETVDVANADVNKTDEKSVNKISPTATHDDDRSMDNIGAGIALVLAGIAVLIMTPKSWVNAIVEKTKRVLRKT